MEKILKSELISFVYKTGILVGIGVLGYICYSIKDILLALLLAFGFVFLTSPILDFIEKRKISSVFSVTLFLLFTSLILVLVVLLILPIVSQEIVVGEKFIKDVLTALQSNPEQIEAQLTSISNRYLEPIGIHIQVQDVVGVLQNQAKAIGEQVLSFMKTSANIIFLGIGNIVQGVTLFGVTLLFYFFAAIDRNKIAKIGTGMLPKKIQIKLQKSHKSMTRALLIWWRGQIIEGTCIAIITGISLWILQLFGLPISNILSLSIIAGLSVFVPLFGPLFAMIPAVIMALHAGIAPAVIVVIIYIVIQQIDGYILIPKIHGQALDFSSFELILYMLIAGSLFGIIGILFTLPVITSIRILVKNLT